MRKFIDISVNQKKNELHRSMIGFKRDKKIIQPSVQMNHLFIKWNQYLVREMLFVFFFGGSECEHQFQHTQSKLSRIREKMRLSIEI